MARPALARGGGHVTLPPLPWPGRALNGLLFIGGLSHLSGYELFTR